MVTPWRTSLVPSTRRSRPRASASSARSGGARAHASGRPYTDPSGVRLRNWLGLDEETFYDARNVVIFGMGLCFPGNDAKGGDLPPRRECAETWHSRILAQLPHIELMLVIGQYAQHFRLDRCFTRDGVTATVRQWRRIDEAAGAPRAARRCRTPPGATADG